MLDKLKKRAQELSQEANDLVETRQRMVEHLRDVDERLAYIVAAVTELNSLIETEERPEFPADLPAS